MATAIVIFLSVAMFCFAVVLGYLLADRRATRSAASARDIVAAERLAAEKAAENQTDGEAWSEFQNWSKRP